MAITNKPAFSIEGQDPEVKDRLLKTNPEQTRLARGTFGHPLKEPVPRFIKTSNDQIIEGTNNTWIVLTRDRPASRLSGYGGRGDTQAGAIDIIAGRMGHKVREFSESGSRLWVDPSFTDDAARIYISQKTDVDENFGLANGSVGTSRAKSAIALKADGVRIIAREGIKLVTGTDELNSQGGSVDSVVGIDLIAGNDDSDLQPIPKGTNLAEALKTLTIQVDKLNGIVDSLLMFQMTFNTALTHHVHFSPFFGLPTTPSPPVVAAGIKTMIDHTLQTKMSLMTNKMNLTLFKQQYLAPSGAKFINSRRNKVN